MTDLPDTPLDPEALKSVDLSIFSSIGTPPTSQMRVPARRGRPPGSRNKPKVTTPAGRIVTEPGEVELYKRVAEKKRAADEATAKILAEGNDYIMLTLISFGLPAELLYKPGQAPTQVETSKYSPLGQKLAVSPTAAKIWGRTWAEFQFSDLGSRVISSGADKAMPLYLVLSGLALVQKLWELNEFRKQVAPFIEVMQRERNTREDSHTVHQGAMA